MNLKQITQALVYDRDIQLRGLVTKLGLDGRKSATVEHQTLGMVAVAELPARPLQAIKGKIEIGHLDEEYDRLLMHPGKVHDWQLHQRVDVNDADGYSAAKSHTIVHHIKFRTIGDEGMDTELGENAGVEYEITIQALRQFVQGQNTSIFELDVFNDIYRVNGEDVWP